MELAIKIWAMGNIYNILEIEGVCLLPFGVNNRAFSNNDIFQVLELLREKGVAIKGGDVWKKDKGEMILTYDNWFIEQKDDETEIEFVNRSIDETKLYINNITYNKDDTYFELVF